MKLVKCLNRDLAQFLRRQVEVGEMIFDAFAEFNRMEIGKSNGISPDVFTDMKNDAACGI